MGWPGVVLRLAGWYNLAWGASVVLAPGWLFAVAGLEPPRYPSIWQCLGMVIGVYGIGYLAAARDPIRHWPIVLVGLLGKIFGPIGFVLTAARGDLPWVFGVTILTNDLIWWVPFTVILARAADRPVAARDERETLDLGDVRTTDGRSLLEVTSERPALVVFVRHAGCTFCKEALSDLSKHRARIEADGVGVVIVHMSTADAGRAFLDGFGLGDVPQISDPERRVYAAFSLKRGGLRQLMGPKTWLRGVMTLRRGHKVTKVVGDPRQMPGVFLVDRGRIVRVLRHESAADRADFVEMACSPWERPG